MGYQLTIDARKGGRITHFDVDSSIFAYQTYSGYVPLPRTIARDIVTVLKQIDPELLALKSIRIKNLKDANLDPKRIKGWIELYWGQKSPPIIGI